MEPKTLPFPELTTDNLGNREIQRANSKNADTVVKIDLDKIVIREGFNVRKDYGNLDELAASILENGQTSPGRVDVLKNGTFALTDGERRYRACCLLAEQGHEVLFKALVNIAQTTEEQRILQMFTTQDNKPLLPHEIAELIKRLINLGHSQVSVAKKISKTPAYISQMLQYANEAPAIKEKVEAGEMKVSTVLQLRKEIPSQQERINAVKNAENNSTPGRSMKAKDVTGTSKHETKIKNCARAIQEHFYQEGGHTLDAESIEIILNKYF
jgi:ParB/RepB/Spo0J family partition protein